MLESVFPEGRVRGPAGQEVHERLLAHSARLEQKLYAVGPEAWCFVGNGLSNQTFVRGPEGVIVIDTGECVEEMEAALAAFREVCADPVVACVYSHFHYIGGTKALLAETPELPIWGHGGIPGNLRRFSGEVGPRGSRGLAHQFGVLLPESGPEGLVNVGLGRFFRNPAHAPFTPGYVPAQHEFLEPTQTTLAGLEVHFLPAPSDATDSITIWFPALKLAVNNLLWPALFNVFAIRGEEYRDPRILLKGLDELGALGATYLAGAHGPPLEGAAQIAEIIQRYRDSIQFLWDQSVRMANRGLGPGEAIAALAWPETFKGHYTTEQLYGLAEHHIRQIYAGLFGWFDEREEHLLPLPPAERAQRLIAGFGGEATVRAALDEALATEDFRWALELGSWLVRKDPGPEGRCDGGAQEDRNRLAQALRGVAYATTSANVRNWSLTRALELEGTLDLSRFRRHRFSVAAVAADPLGALSLLRVQLDPARLTEEGTLVFDFGAGGRGSLTLRRGIAVPGTEQEVEGAVRLTLAPELWGALLAGKQTLVEALAAGAIVASDGDRAQRMLSAFELPAFRAEG